MGDDGGLPKVMTGVELVRRGSGNRRSIIGSEGGSDVGRAVMAPAAPASSPAQSLRL